MNSSIKEGYGWPLSPNQTTINQLYIGAVNLSSSNDTDSSHMPPLPTFDYSRKVKIVVLAVIFVASLAANLSVLWSLLKNNRRSSANVMGQRVRLFILNLILSDLIETVIIVLSEAIWNYTIAWYAGEAMCRIVKFLQIFSLLAPSFMLIAISIDRYIAIAHPLTTTNADRRCRLSIIAVWVASALFASPQLFMYKVISGHPEDPSFEQCVPRYRITSVNAKIYFVYMFTFMFAIPFIVIVTMYLMIVREIFRKSKDIRENGKVVLRRSGQNGKPIPSAKMKSIKFTSIIILGFIICTAPYQTITVMLHTNEAYGQTISGIVREVLFNLALLNVIADPIIYGLITTNMHRKFKMYCCRQFKIGRQDSESLNIRYRSKISRSTNDSFKKTTANSSAKAAPRDTAVFNKVDGRSDVVIVNNYNATDEGVSPSAVGLLNPKYHHIENNSFDTETTFTHFNSKITQESASLEVATSPCML